MEQKEEHLHVHLEELRRRIIRVLLVFVVSAAGGFFYVKPMYAWLVRDLDGKLTILGPTDILWAYFMIAGSFAVAFTIPYAACQLWMFVKPALSVTERRAALLFIPALAVLFLIGVSFGYFVLFPIMLAFMKSVAEDTVLTMYTVESYFRFLINMTLPFGLLFEMPAVVMFLTSIGILNPVRLAKARKLAYFVLTVLSISITPPDFLSDILVTVPLLLLYEFSISLSKRVYNRKLRRAQEEEETGLPAAG
ncbi:twin-arginine translocase subunit TatC [Paenibacillus aurantius]|uniref:Sec-independent protein translocase protein TatC n=1 Tax=Paenibacillus aurantius TaxID=2918900 RepID=A0AA96L968_9BACL|nr:twin-arginine translocase subunit TatC [Paenibacillus aurantius]WNQ09000.1 twin-arginine translocase subunit TatC [Paenibacillus aurantius]